MFSYKIRVEIHPIIIKYNKPIRVVNRYFGERITGTALQTPPISADFFW